MTTAPTEPRCSYDVILPGIDNEAPCALPAGHDGGHAPTEPRTVADALMAAATAVEASRADIRDALRSATGNSPSLYTLAHHAFRNVAGFDLATYQGMYGDALTAHMLREAALVAAS